mgnify:CR=1 FL=1
MDVLSNDVKQKVAIVRQPVRVNSFNNGAVAPPTAFSNNMPTPSTNIQTGGYNNNP